MCPERGAYEALGKMAVGFTVTVSLVCCPLPVRRAVGRPLSARVPLHVGVEGPRAGRSLIIVARAALAARGSAACLLRLTVTHVCWMGLARCLGWSHNGGRRGGAGDISGEEPSGSSSTEG